MSLISVIVPVYNAGKYVEECILSLLNQDYSNIEIILVNDGSVDDSIDICNFYKEKDDRVKVIDKNNEGASVARNCGLNIARGDYISFVDSDDFVSRELYVKLISLIDKNNSDCAALTEYVVNKNGGARFQNGRLLSSNEALGFLFELQFPTSVWAYLYKRSAVANIRLNSEVHFYEDLEFNARVFLNSESISCCSEELYFYRQHSDSTNSHGVSAKRLTCLSIADSLSGIILREQDEVLIDKLNFLEAYMILSVLEPIENPISDDHSHYINFTSSHIRKSISGIVKSKVVPLKFKLYFFVALFDISFAVRLKNFSKRFL